MSDEPAQTIADIHEHACDVLNDAWTLLHSNREAIDPLELARAYTSLAEAYVNLARDIRMVASAGKPDADAKPKRTAEKRAEATRGATPNIEPGDR
jgi:hypothetical protein